MKSSARNGHIGDEEWGDGVEEKEGRVERRMEEGGKVLCKVLCKGEKGVRGWKGSLQRREGCS